MRKLFYGTWAFFGKMLNLSSVVFVVGGGGGLCNVHRVTPTAAAAGGLCDAHRFIKITSYKIKVYIHNKNI